MNYEFIIIFAHKYILNVYIGGMPTVCTNIK